MERITKDKIKEEIIKSINETEGIDPQIVERLEKEYFELCERRRHHGSSRWNMFSFMMLLSFAITGYLLPFTKSTNKSLSEWYLIFGPIIYTFAIWIYYRQRELNYAIRDYQENGLRYLLGIYSEIYIKNWMHNKKRLPNILETKYILVLIGFMYWIGILMIIYCK